jgi:ribosomal protein S18 acetylase RimI-like enzyme
METVTMARQWQELVPTSHIRAMWPADLEQVLLVERVSFPRQYWWQAEDFRRCFCPQTRNVAQVVEMAGRMVAFCVTYAQDHRTLMIDSVAVLPAFRRMGLARCLLGRVEQKSFWCVPERLRALVTERNLEAQLFLRACGWRAVGMQTRPWKDSEDDAIKFFKRIIKDKG